MSEPEKETQDDQAAGETTPAGAAETDADSRDDALDPAEDADNPGGVTDEQHVSSVTDLSEGAEVDPLTDKQPAPVVESETHDE